MEEAGTTELLDGGGSGASVRWDSDGGMLVVVSGVTVVGVMRETMEGREVWRIHSNDEEVHNAARTELNRWINIGIGAY